MWMKARVKTALNHSCGCWCCHIRRVQNTPPCWQPAANSCMQILRDVQRQREVSRLHNSETLAFFFFLGERFVPFFHLSIQSQKVCVRNDTGSTGFDTFFKSTWQFARCMWSNMKVWNYRPSRLQCIKLQITPCILDMDRLLIETGHWDH